MEVHLWEWSDAAQISSTLIIVVFFGVLHRSVGRLEVRWWMRAWTANLAALAVTVGFWVFVASGKSAPADGFKQINDVHGHHAGDAALRRFADALVESFRPDDAVVRYAGDEFVVIAKGMDLEAASGRAHALRASGHSIAIEFSFGVTALAPGMTLDEALRDADAAMYARKSGRPAPRPENRVPVLT